MIAVFKTDKARDLLIVVALMVGLWVPATEAELFDLLYYTSRDHEDWDLDEFVVLLLISPLPIAWYAVRRAREARDKTRRLLEVERKLAHSQKLESLGTLAGGMAHHVNNQLQPVIGLSELIISQLEPEDPKRRQMDMIYEAAMRARGSVDKVLRISRRDAEGWDENEIAQHMADLVELLRLSCPSNVTFEAQLDEGLTAVALPWSDLESVAMNLFSNAVAAVNGQPGQISLAVTMAADPQSQKPCLHLSVADTGTGIAQDKIGRIFEPFYTSKPVGQGTGLGLWQVREMLEEIGGRIEVTSALGEGARFDVWVPKPKA
jgi:signal transduction histidine kinase